ncbi:hypothetical protein FHS29_006815 [Saccharothrix tamanrassetensis]|uniref:STAS domain-containing protein n=1 Tax=Saccharothrix tamanrassetensis TaxID=1051531 RepID=A0A841CP17_9PSEU|nr:hypothetical protein [Saccharothrix tamanrassetensis]MBB5960192.1 hypothetical protein [Saccharothrix tamanrassetensis]
MRDVLLKTVLAQPTAVVVDMSELRVERDIAVSVFQAVWAQVAEWPGVPILLAGSRRPADWSLPSFATVRDALASVGAPPERWVVRAPLPLRGSAEFARLVAEETCRVWGLDRIAAAAADIADALVGLAARGIRPTAVFERWRGRLVVGASEEAVVPCTPLELRCAATGANRCGWSTTWSDGTLMWAVIVP